MYATQMQAYRKVEKLTETGRDIEASVLNQAALKLTECQLNWDAADRDARLSEALRFNQIIWSIFQGELAKEDNPLPKKLKQDILSLSLFIDKRIIDVLANPLRDKLDIIISINLSLAAGLRGNPA